LWDELYLNSLAHVLREDSRGGRDEMKRLAGELEQALLAYQATVHDARDQALVNRFRTTLTQTEAERLRALAEIDDTRAEVDLLERDWRAGKALLQEMTELNRALAMRDADAIVEAVEDAQ